MPDDAQPRAATVHPRPSCPACTAGRQPGKRRSEDRTSPEA